MPIPFACPHCGAESLVDEQYAGHSGPCKACGKIITVPGLREGGGPAKPSRSSAAPILAVVLVVMGVAALSCLGVLTALLLPAVQTAREAARRAQCTNHLKQIAVAMHNYHDVYGSFPPAYIPDEDGRPMHSWRTLLLPFLEQSAVYDKYDFSKPWDSPENAAATSAVIPIFGCPHDEHGASTETDYLAVTGPETIFDGAKPCRLAEVRDGTSNTILVAEVSGSGVHWAEPRDLPLAGIAAPPNLGGPGQLGGPHADGAHVALADGAVRVLGKAETLESIRSLCTKAGGEPMPAF